MCLLGKLANGDFMAMAVGIGDMRQINWQFLGTSSFTPSGPPLHFQGTSRVLPWNFLFFYHCREEEKNCTTHPKGKRGFKVIFWCVIELLWPSGFQTGTKHVGKLTLWKSGDQVKTRGIKEFKGATKEGSKVIFRCCMELLWPRGFPKGTIHVGRLSFLKSGK